MFSVPLNEPPLMTAAVNWVATGDGQVSCSYDNY